MKTTKDELERTYDVVDPWGYQTHPADIERKQIILDTAERYGPFAAALDVACGEGWITKDIQAREIWGHEFSRKARERWPSCIKQYHPLVGYPQGTFDLVMITGALYENYDWESFVEIINRVGSGIVITCNIATREFWKATEAIEGQLVEVKHFDYHRSPEEMFTQRLRVYRR